MKKGQGEDTSVTAISPLLEVLRGGTRSPPPIWLMRQAGRYLPEYRELRTAARDFLDFCYTPELAVEATLQPVRRYDFDAAILFSDILVIPDALGQAVRFVEGEGPQLETLDLSEVSPVRRLHRAGMIERLTPVYTAVSRVRAALPEGKSLIGFCGAPWTLATYMVGGRSGNDQWPTRKAALTQPERFAELIELLVDACASHLLAQVEAGADVLQIFDSWAGALDEIGFERWSIAPVAAIVRRVRAAAPEVPVIGFPRGAGSMLETFAKATQADAVSIDWSTSIASGRELQRICAVQGNLDPARLVVGGDVLHEAVARILAGLAQGPFIFNLGHGISLETPPAHVEALVAQVRAAG